MEQLKDVFPELYLQLQKGFIVPLRLTQDGNLAFVFSEDYQPILNELTTDVISCTSHPATIFLYYKKGRPWAHAIEYYT